MEELKILFLTQQILKEKKRISVKRTNIKSLNNFLKIDYFMSKKLKENSDKYIGQLKTAILLDSCDNIINVIKCMYVLD